MSPYWELQSTEGVGALIELKPGGPRCLFLVHDGDGNTQLYLNLARRMPDDVAVFGIVPGSTPEIKLAHTRIEDMAHSYLEKLRQRQRRGPYFLGGLCAGGVIAHEMASQLLRAGEMVELVVLLDAATPQAFKRRGYITEQRFARLKQEVVDACNKRDFTSVVAVSLRKFVNALSWEIMRFIERLGVQARFLLLRQLLARQLPWPAFIPKLSWRQIYESAVALYVPKPLLDGSAVLVRARNRTPVLSDTPYRAIYADEALGWGTIIQRLDFIDVNGGHSTMLEEPFVGSLAAALLVHISRKPDRSDCPRSQTCEG